MAPPLGFDALKSILYRQIDPLPDHRQAGPNTRYRIQDAALGAFGIFFTQSPSLLEYQRHLQQTKGQNHASTMFGVETLPCNNQIRNLRDPLLPSALDRVYFEVFEGLEQHGWLAHFRGLANQLWLAMDGTQYFSSNTIHCPNCLQRQTAKHVAPYGVILLGDDLYSPTATLLKHALLTQGFIGTSKATFPRH